MSTIGILKGDLQLMAKGLVEAEWKGQQGSPTQIQGSLFHMSVWASFV